MKSSPGSLNAALVNFIAASTIGLFLTIVVTSSLFFPYKDRLARDPLCPRLHTKLVAGTVMNQFTSVKQSAGYMIGNPNISKSCNTITSALADHAISTGHSLKWDGGGGYSTDALVGRCGPGVQTLTLFKTQFSDFHIPFETEFKIFRPYLRHLI